MKTRPMPSIKSDAAAERFADTAELSRYDLSGFKPLRFEPPASPPVAHGKDSGSLKKTDKPKRPPKGCSST